MLPVERMDLEDDKFDPGVVIARADDDCAFIGALPSRCFERSPKALNLDSDFGSLRAPSGRGSSSCLACLAASATSAEIEGISGGVFVLDSWWRITEAAAAPCLASNNEATLGVEITVEGV